MQSESVKITKQWKRWLMPLAFCVLLLTSTFAADEPDTESGVLRSRVYKLEHITSQQAQALLSQLHIGKGYNPLSANVLILTSDIGTDLIKATEVIGLLDQQPPATIRVLTEDIQSLPQPGAFITGLKSITVGTMIESPPDESENPAIIDIHDNKLIAIASEDVLDKITAAFQEWKKENQVSVPENAVADQSSTPDKSESLRDIARQLLEMQPATDANDLTEEAKAQITEPVAEPNKPADGETQDQTPEDFLSEGLLQELADAEQKARAERTPDEKAVAEAAEATEPQPATTETKTTAAEEPAQEEPPKDDPMKIMQAFLAQAQAAKEQTKPGQDVQQPQEAIQPELVPTPAEADEIQAAQPTKEPAAAAEAKIQKTPTVQTEPQIDPQLAEEELETVVDILQEVELETLIDLVGKQLGLNYMYDPDIFGAAGKKEKVQLKLHGGRIKVKDTYKLLQSVLRLKGYVMTRDGQLVTIVKSADAAAMNGIDIIIRRPEDPILPGYIVVSTIFDLKHISAATAKEMLQSMNLGLDQNRGFHQLESSTLIVTDYANRMARIENVLKMIDVPGEQKIFEYRTLQYMEPTELLPKLQELAGQLEDVSLQISAPATSQKMVTKRVRDPKTGKMVNQQVPVTTTTTAPQKPASADTVFIDTDDRTNRILMTGKADQIKLINELIDALDVPQYDLKFVREYIIQNIEAAEVVEVLNELGLASVEIPTTSTRTSTTSGRTQAQARSAQQRAAAARSGAGTETDGSQPNISIRPSANSLLVNATAEQHSAIELVIAHVDIVQKDQRTIRQYEIQNVEATEVITTLEELGIIAPQSTSGYDSYSRSRSATSRTRQDTGRSAQQQAASEGVTPVSLPIAGGGSEKELTADQPQISVLETTNSLLVYATPRQHDAISLVIAHTDRQLDSTTTPYVIYALENQDPLELADVLTRLIQETVKEVAKTSTPDAKIQRNPGVGATTSLPTLEEQNIRVIPDEMSYSLIVYANKKNQQWISELIRELDEYRPQVLLDCTLVQVSRDDKFQYGIDLITKSYKGTSVQESGPVGKSEGVPIYGEFSLQRLADIQNIDGTVTGFFNSEMVQGLLTAMEQDGYGRVMSQPKVLVNDNQEGEIKTENVTSVAQQKSIIQPSSDQGQTITTTDVSFVEYTSGVTLKIKPHISKGDMLRLEITLNRTDFDDSVKSVTVAGTSYPQPPDLLSADVTTVATVPDGTTIILGGLESVDQNKTHKKVPFFGDLPLIGTLFRDVDNSDQLSKLYVFVKANIIRPGDQVEGLQDIRRVSKKYRDEFEEMEEQFQGLQEFPGFESKPMDPVKVLEDDDFRVGTVSMEGS